MTVLVVDDDQRVRTMQEGLWDPGAVVVGAMDGTLDVRSTGPAGTVTAVDLPASVP